MKFVNNVLTEDAFQVVIDNIKHYSKLNLWTSSSLFWSPEIRVGNHVGVLTHLIKGPFADYIEKEISHFLPEYARLQIQMYLWPEGSNISWHDDNGFSFGATIYLNRHWEINYGGLFVWEDSDTKELKILCPCKNTMVINDKKEGHCVTHVTSAAPETRMTLQIWGYTF